MTVSVSELEQLKKEVQNAATRRERAIGAKDSALKTLKTRYGCSTVSAARKKLAKLKRDLAQLDSRIDDEIAAFKKEYDL